MLKKTLWRVSGGRKQGGCSKCRVVGFDHSWQLQLIEPQRKHCMGQGRRWLHVCGRSLPEFPSCSRPDTNGPWISSQITLQYLPVQKPVWLLSDTWALLQFGLSCYLGQLSVFHLRDQQTSDDEVGFFPSLKWEVCQQKHMSDTENMKWIPKLLNEAWVEKKGKKNLLFVF